MQAASRHVCSPAKGSLLIANTAAVSHRDAVLWRLHSEEGESGWEPGSSRLSGSEGIADVPYHRHTGNGTMITTMAIPGNTVSTLAAVSRTSAMSWRGSRLWPIEISAGCPATHRRSGAAGRAAGVLQLQRGPCRTTGVTLPSSSRVPKARQFPKEKPEPYPLGSPETASPSSSNGSGKPSTMRAVSTDRCTIRLIALTRSRGSSNHPLGSLTMPLCLSWTIL